MDTRLRPGPAEAVCMSQILKDLAWGLLLAAVLPCLFISCSAKRADALPFRWRSPSVVAPQPAARPAGASLYAGGQGYYRQRYIQDRVIDLPEDGDLMHMTIIGNGSAESVRVQKYFSESPRLNSLAQQCKYHVYKPSDPYASYFTYDPKPVAILQNVHGKVLWKKSGASIPRSGEEMADDIESALWAYSSDCGPDGCKPDEEHPAEKLPDLSIAKPSGGGIDPNDLLVIGLIVAAGFALVMFLRKQ
jgi:hypothetical protein